MNAMTSTKMFQPHYSIDLTKGIFFSIILLSSLYIDMYQVYLYPLQTSKDFDLHVSFN